MKSQLIDAQLAAIIKAALEFNATIIAHASSIYNLDVTLASRKRVIKTMSKASEDYTKRIYDILQVEDPSLTKKVNRLEIIDESGRIYVRGAMYGTPSEIKLSYQDDGRTLKVFVKDKE